MRVKGIAMEILREINFDGIKLRIETPSENNVLSLYNQIGYRYFNSIKDFSLILKEASRAYNKKSFYQYMVYLHNQPIGMLRLDTVRTNIRIIKASESYKMNIILLDNYVKEIIIEKIIFGLINYYDFKKGILIAVLPENTELNNVLKSQLFKEIEMCRFNDLIIDSKNEDLCRFYYFNSNQSDFILKNALVIKNKRKIFDLFFKKKLF